jgi:hypothetical protein
VRETIKKTWEENFVRDSRRKKQTWEKMYENNYFNIAATCSFFLAHLTKKLFYIFFSLSNVYGILSI